MLIGVVLASLAGFGRDRQLEKLQKTYRQLLGRTDYDRHRGHHVGRTVAGLHVLPGTDSVAHQHGRKRHQDRSGRDRRQETLREVPRCQGRQDRAEERQRGGRGEDERGRRREASKEIAAALSGRYSVAADGSIALKNAEKDGAAIKGVEPVKVAGMNAKEAADKIAAALGVPEKSETDAKVTLTTPETLDDSSRLGSRGFQRRHAQPPLSDLPHDEKKSWGVLLTNWKEVGLTVIMGIQTLLALTLPGKGMVMLGALGAAIGGGIQQAMQMVGGQGTGFISGEWRGVHGKPRWQMYGSIALLIIASFIMAYSKTIKQ